MNSFKKYKKEELVRLLESIHSTSKNAIVEAKESTKIYSKDNEYCVSYELGYLIGIINSINTLLK